MGGEKLGNFKKIIAAVFLCTAAIFCLYSQSQNINTVSEESIVLSESSVDGNTVESSSVNYKGASTIGTFIRMIVALLIVVALIYGVLWFVRKKTNVMKNDDEYLRRAAYINISPSKTIEVITLIDKAYLIGVTEDNITLLGEINDKELVEAMNINSDKKNSSTKPVNFSQVLDSFLIKGKGNKSVFSEAENKVDEIFNNVSNDNGEQ